MSIDYAAPSIPNERWTFNDGGRSLYFKGFAGDCCCRAFSIGTGTDYKENYDLINQFAQMERTGKRKGKKRSKARDGVFRVTARKMAHYHGLKWQPTMLVGSGSKVHLTADELPECTIICSVSKHFVAVIDGIVNDTYDCTREGKRCVYGFWYHPEDEAVVSDWALRNDI